MGKGNLENAFWGKSKEKTVETKNLRIQGHLLSWKGSVIQISNISLITTSDVRTAPFPLWAGVIILVGIALLREVWYVGLILFAISGTAIYFWYSSVQEAKTHKYLNILLNSGQTYSIMFQDEKFLKEVLRVFANIFEEGSAGNVNYNINIRDSVIDHNSSVVNSAAR